MSYRNVLATSGECFTQTFYIIHYEWTVSLCYEYIFRNLANVLGTFQISYFGLLGKHYWYIVLLRYLET
jgi:hypothetical protein